MKLIQFVILIFILGCKSNETIIKTSSPIASSPIEDIDGNQYLTVIIGRQTWMAENLKTTQFNDEKTIPLVSDNDDWAALTTPGYTWYNNNESKYRAEYGALYNWYTVNTGKLCPIEWHIPSDDEWDELIVFLGENAGGKLKEAGLLHWEENAPATNETGFTALPAGGRWANGQFNEMIGWGTAYWSSTEFNEYHAYGRELTWFSSNVNWFYDFKNDGFSVRCIKD